MADNNKDNKDNKDNNKAKPDDDAVELRTVHVNDAAQNAQYKFTCVVGVTLSLVG